MMNKEKKSVLDTLLDEIDPLEAKKTENRMLLAARIDELIKRRGWSKTGFAALMRQQPSVVSKWLSGTHNFTQDTLTEIAQVLEITLEELFREKPQELVHKAHFSVYSPIHHLTLYGGGPHCLHSPSSAYDQSYVRLGEKGRMISWAGTNDLNKDLTDDRGDWLKLGACLMVGAIKDFNSKEKTEKVDQNITPFKT